MSAEHYDLVVVGSGFGSLFFVEGFLRKRPTARVLVLERGRHHSHRWQIENGRNSAVAPEDTYRTPPGHKIWNFTIGLGGGTNCWFAQTPRFHPSDFRLRTLYGVGQDWPFGYDELEPYYVLAERKMAVAGSPDMAELLPRSAPFPLPPHALTSVDRVMRAAQPAFHFPMATARASAVNPQRARCCASARCNLCPVDAKFTFENGFRNLREHPSVEFRTECPVTRLDLANDTVQGVIYETGGEERRASGELYVLGANALHSPAILLRSGADHPFTGVGIHEQAGYSVEVLLDGLDNFDGGTITTALNYALYDGEFRRSYGSALIYFENRWPYGLRTEFGRWRQLAPLVVVVEDLPQDQNRVVVDDDGMPRVLHERISEYARVGVERSFEALEKVLAPLPVERIDFKGMRATESHVQGSLRMGRDPATSVVDADQVHHRLRNLVVVGSAVFPTGPCANPSLTVAAMSLRSADRLA
ncbi:MAG: 2-keto-gluconate dehydrogenase [Proteobacteria bacterium]|nr:MAG: 2-keto-gluconate dehydrogenase [Pseudomonadota bacterium]